ncbi:MAG: Nicotinate-nucleotide adenylyltransferase [uncultured Thermomicrobiales bacterium]|uniref:Probable nicotinate-nucleotide adenylyltransferase n=1 Tax=uncultured Thermomicrobiales bacterium TaxID=1645740 RepID=A0A6J4UTB6_9BACT|nr:MAG: Nicotinate-nucleotide adenylyltransferase [uncultured Thermomicrobiales bacterium]
MTDQPPRIGVFGGTFDPVHLGHLIVASEVCHALSLDRLLFVPSRSPHKTNQGTTEDHHRLAMLRLAVAGDARFAIDTLELDRPGPSYTADTLDSLTRRLSPARLVFVMGEDSLRDFPTWHDPGRITRLAEIAVAHRPGVRADLAAVEAAVPESRGRIRLVPIPPIGVSSRDVRRRVATGAPIAHLLPAAVERYIRDHGLYRPGRDPVGAGVPRVVAPRFQMPVAAHVFLLRPGAVLLARRHGTGFQDGRYGPVGGHLDGDEPVTVAAARECREEIGVTIQPTDFRFLGVAHWRSSDGEGVDFFFACGRWTGEPRPVADCDDVRWFPIDRLPDTTIPFVRRAIEHHLLGKQPFDEDGWNPPDPVHRQAAIGP